MSVTPDLRLLQPSSVGFVYCLLVFWFLWRGVGHQFQLYGTVRGSSVSNTSNKTEIDNFAYLTGMSTN